jgi:hypothetical protein
MVSISIKGGVTSKKQSCALTSEEYYRHGRRASNRILYRGEGQRYTDYEWCCMCNADDEYYAQTITIMNTSLTRFSFLLFLEFCNFVFWNKTLARKQG